MRIIQKTSGTTNKTTKQSLPSELAFKAHFLKELRYGENPHQKANWYKTEMQGLHQAEKLQGKILSYNNLIDFCSAIHAVRDFKEPCVVAVKHNNPCAVAEEKNISLALEKTLKADPVSVFGGVLAFNRPVDEASAGLLSSLFLEGVIAPDFSKEALDVLKSRKNLRILKWSEMLSFTLSPYSVHEIIGGVLLQTRDQVNKENWPENWKSIGLLPSKDIKKDLFFAWKVCAHLKSNAIAVVKHSQSLGLGMGQVSRVEALRLALKQVKTFHPSQQKDLILASDAFFPFVDSIELAKEGGVSWIIQPGGSIKDKQVIEKALELGLNIILTGQRHFKH